MDSTWEGRRYRRRLDRCVRLATGGASPSIQMLGPVLKPKEDSQQVVLDMAPSHPATNGHGAIRLRVLVENDRIEQVDVQAGFTHRGVEKSFEASTWTMIFPYTDRLNFASPFINNFSYASAVEKLCDVEIPERAKYCRTIAAEISRITDHLSCLTSCLMVIGSSSQVQHLVQARELFWGAAEELAGARLTVGYARVGGVNYDLPAGFEEHMSARFTQMEDTIRGIEKMLNSNRFFLQRMVGIGVMPSTDAISWGWTGPCLRSTGVPYDVRRTAPYDVYDRISFDIPVGTNGDNYDRYLIRLEEIRQSRRIIEQCLHQVKDTEPKLIVDDFRLRLPRVKAHGIPKGLGEMINHFKIVVDGIQVPSGEAYAYQEGANGELGFYVLSTGGGKPWKLHVRAPCFAIASSLTQLLRGQTLTNVASIFESLNIISGECDR